MVQTYFTGENDTRFNKNQLLDPRKGYNLFVAKAQKVMFGMGPRLFLVVLVVFCKHTIARMLGLLFLCALSKQLCIPC
jgi:hypothetical protein